MSEKPTYEELERRVLELENAESERKRMEEALRKSEARQKEISGMLEALFDAIPDALGIQDTQHGMIRYNRAGYEFVQKTTEEVQGHKCFEIIGRKAPCPVCATSEVYRTLKPARVEKYVEELDIWLDVRAYPVLDDESRLQLVIEHMRDITERKKVEKTLEYESNFQRVIGEIANEFINISLSGIDAGVNRALKTIGEFVGADRSYVIWFDFLTDTIRNTHEWCGEGIEPQIDNLQDVPIKIFDWVVKQLVDFQIVYIPKVEDMPPEAETAKQEFEVEGIQSMLLVPLMSKGRCIGTIGFDFVRQARTCSEREIRLLQTSGATLSDVMDRKLAEEALRTSEGRLMAIFEANPDPVVVYDLQGFPSYLNPAFTDVFGWTLSELEGERIPFVPENQMQTTAAKIEEIYKTKKPVRFLSRRLTKQGNPLEVIVSAAIIKGSDDNSIGMVVNLTDISEQRRLEAQLRQAQKMESVGRLAGGVAHDFNNMLSVILGNAEMALEQMDKRLPGHANLLEIRKAARRSADITRQLLAFARKQTITPKVLDLNITIESMLKMLRRLIGEDIDLVWLPDDELWPVRVDPSQIDQILANLSVNARDAIAGVGKLTIETAKVTYDEAYCSNHPGFVPGDFVQLAVSDNGCGMDKETLKNLFEPFFSTKEVGKGTGLGLATVYGIVKQNDGFINVYSEPDVGASFKIYLPRHEASGVQAREKNRAQLVLQGSETILLVEDETAIMKMAAKILESLGYSVLTAITPGEAINLAREHGGDIHLLMTDVVMPEMNGWDLAKNLMSIYPNIKRLFMSGYTANVIAHHGVLDEGVNFIQKPFSIKDLSVKVREVLMEES